MKIYYDLVIIYLDYAGVSTGEITAFWTQLAFKKKKKNQFVPWKNLIA